MNTRIETAKERIQNGAKFNGVIYGKRANKNNVDLQIYLDGSLVHLTRIDPTDVEETKKEILSFFQIEEKQEIKKNEWLVDGKRVTNNLDYGQMFDRYGMDFE